MKKRYLITIDEDVYKALKMRAVRDNTTVGDLLAELVDYESSEKTEEVRQLKAQLARRPTQLTGSSYNSRPFTPVPKK